jgi:mRNA interferase MazF
MGKFVKGDVVIIPFPFSDYSSQTKRPAVVIKELTGNDVILCQITSNNRSDGYSIPLSSEADFANGSLRHDSFIRPNRLFTAESSLILYKAGTLSEKKMNDVTTKLVQIISS